ncbi:MraY family glycosyltransferase [Pararhodospirillum photometricum]|uniref:Glycosyl transferase, family 4 n=1 Tax=Pararhodospirillum photometricum DSM 122 TaxID=1150469 RepID=H6SIY6_PARPM|nr:glycosyltransferase family 4 protein [Pararhodospirillum photometricum]CCG07951.1 Glycosyl transferase, family 4 [Pararhodospirillum photometricum DSM 122]
MLNDLLPALLPAAVAVPLSALATGKLAAVLRARHILDLPNARSSHVVPTPRGGGLAVMGVALPLAGLTWALTGAPIGVFGLGLLAAGLAALSFWDDLRPLPAGKRLLAHLLAVALGMLCLPAGALTLGGLVSPWLGAVGIGLGWVWFLNLYNFMDGIDGLAGVETVSLGLGLLAVAAVAGDVGGPGLAVAPILAGAALGFLRWNWHPARIFLGDVGSIPLGFLLGAALLGLAAQGHAAAAVILPGAYLADATLTLLNRVRRGHKPWEAHREHFYQKAVQGGWSHDRVARAYALTNGGLFLLALLSLASPLPALAGAVALVTALLVTLARVGAKT